MADGTRMESIEEQLRKQEARISELSDTFQRQFSEVQSKNMEFQSQMVAKMDSGIAGLQAQVSALANLFNKDKPQPEGATFQMNKAPILTAPDSSLRLIGEPSGIKDKGPKNVGHFQSGYSFQPKIELPFFSGENPREGVRKCDKILGIDKTNQEAVAEEFSQWKKNDVGRTDERITNIEMVFVASSANNEEVVRCDTEAEAEIVEASEEASDLGIVGDEVQDISGGSFIPAPGVEAVCVFPKNPSKLVTAGEESELLVGVKNDGDSSLNVIAIQASVHVPYNHQYLIQNLSAQAFNNASVPPAAQATFPYIFAVSKFLQPGAFDRVGTIVYEIDTHPYQNTFYNGTIEVMELGGPLSIESVFLVPLAIAFLGFIVFTVRSRIQNYSKKTKRTPKVEVGTGTTDASMDEWLQGTTFYSMVFVASSDNNEEGNNFLDSQANLKVEISAKLNDDDINGGEKGHFHTRDEKFDIHNCADNKFLYDEHGNLHGDLMMFEKTEINGILGHNWIDDRDLTGAIFDDCDDNCDDFVTRKSCQDCKKLGVIVIVMESNGNIDTSWIVKVTGFKGGTTLKHHSFEFVENVRTENFSDMKVVADDKCTDVVVLYSNSSAFKVIVGNEVPDFVKIDSSNLGRHGVFWELAETSVWELKRVHRN